MATIFGLMIVRNEADIVRTNLLYHIALGIDRFLVVDNGSEDGTGRILQELSQNGRISWTRDAGPYKQSEITTELALEAYLRGADWVVPVDADEFWYAPGGNFRGVLEQSGAGALRVEVVNYIQKREQRDTTPDVLLTMTRRSPKAIGPLERVRELIETQQFGYVEAVYAPKWISRATSGLQIGVGNHLVDGAAGPLEETDQILCLHAPLRSQSVFEAQVGHARRAVEAGNLKVWHWIRWKQLAEKGGLGPEWRANSYQDGYLDVYGVAHPVAEDYRLRDLVAPWIGAELKPEPTAFLPPLVAGRRLSGCDPELVQTTLTRMSRIEGWLTGPEAILLMATTALALTEHESHDVVEIGSYCGRSTVVLGSVVKTVSSGLKVHAIDPHQGELSRSADVCRPTLERFQKNVDEAGLADVVASVCKRSYEVTWDRPISFLFIDGLHDYENVSRDFNHFQKWVVPSGYVAFHDYDPAYPGVIAFVDELLASGEYRRFHLVGSLIMLEKIEIMGNDKPGDIATRLARQEKGISVLRDLLRDTMARRETELVERDRRIAELQQELFSKVGERDETIRKLQAELHEKVDEANRVICDLHAELNEKIGERDRVILSLQAELHEKVGERDEIIRKLQADLEHALRRR